MKRKILLATLLLTGLSLIFNSCNKSEPDGPSSPTTPTTPEASLLSSFWFGYYQEDAVTNPEDPLPGFIYLNIPDSGSFDGELFFSYSGCEGGVDVGRATGTAGEGSLVGTWQGTVDGRSVGGEYTGQLKNGRTIEGAYSNEEGKVEIVCDPDFSYFVAPRGSLFLENTGSNQALNILVDTESNPVSLTWNGASGVGVLYNVVFIDAECLQDKVSVRDCLMWSGVSTSSSIVYGEGITDDVPAEPLVSGKTYLASITCINSEGQALASSNITFVKP